MKKMEKFGNGSILPDNIFLSVTKSNTMKNIFISLSLSLATISMVSAQPEVYPWGNIKGLRVDGELMELNSSLGFVGADWSSIRKTAKERAGYSYRRDDRTQTTYVNIDSFFYDQSIEDLGAGMANLRIHYRNAKDTAIIGTFLMMNLPAATI